MSTIVHTLGTGRSALRLAAGLRWVVLDAGSASRPGKPRPDKIRAQAKASGASSYVLQQADQNTTTIGLYSEPMQPSKGGKIYSLSMLFLRGVQREAAVDRNLINVALMLEPQGAPTMRVLVFIEAGQITRDLVLERSRAIEQLDKHVAVSPGLSVFSQHAEISHAHTPITWSNIDRLVDKSAVEAVLRPVPRSPFVAIALVFAVLLASSWFAYDHYVRQPEKKRRAAAELARRDQTPAYLAAVNQELQTSGFDRADLVALLTGLRGRPALTAAWALEQITCDTRQCTTTWSRRGGLSSDLAAALPNETIVPGDTSAGGSSLEKAYTQVLREAKTSSLDRLALPVAATSAAQLVSVAQKMTNASIPVTLRETRAWDAVPLVNVAPQAVLRKGDLEISVMPHQAADVLALLPPNVLIHSVTFKVAESIQVIFKGASYAQSQQ